MPVPENILNAQCPHKKPYRTCEDPDCNDYLDDIETMDTWES